MKKNSTSLNFNKETMEKNYFIHKKQILYNNLTKKPDKINIIK